MPSTLAILVVLGAVYYFTTREEKQRFFLIVRRHALVVADAAARFFPERGPFGDALRERTPWVIVTPVLIAINVVMFFAMLMGAGALSDPQTLVGWGASIAPRTTNGEWWRLVAATFVQPTFFHLLFTIVGLAQVGVILERLVGRAALIGTYVASGLTAALVSLATRPMEVTAGASACVFGVYGLFAASFAIGLVTHSPLRVPWWTIVRLLPAGCLFVLYSAAAGIAGSAQAMGFATGVAFGLAVSKDVAARTVPVLRAGAALGVVVVLAAVAAFPLRGFVDVRPELDRVAAVEQSTASAYDDAVRRFTKGEISIGALAQLIDRTILPELRAARARLKQLGTVPADAAPMVLAADEYFTLREQSWRARAEALRKSSTAALKQADRSEEASLRTLERIRPALQQQ